MNKKLSKYITLMAILTINTSPLLNTAGAINSNVVEAETIGQAVTFTLNADEIETIMFWAGEDSKNLTINQRYEITFEGSGQVEIYHNHNPYETNDLIKVIDGKASGIVNRSFVEADSITIKASKDTNLKVIFTPVSELDYTYLNELIADATELLKDNSDKYTADSWNRLSNAKYNAEFYLTAEYISHAELKNIENTLKNAIDNLTTLVSVVNRKPLEEALNKVKVLNETDYTTATWKQLMTELKEAQDIYDDETSLPGDIQTATNNLNTTFQLLTKRADFSDLNKTIEEATTYEEEDYTISTYAELQRMLKEAETVAKDLNNNQSNVDTATTNLKNAIKDLKEKGESGNNGGEETENSDEVRIYTPIFLKDTNFAVYNLYYSPKNDELRLVSGSNHPKVKKPKTVENIKLNGNNTFEFEGEKWSLDKENQLLNYEEDRIKPFKSLEEFEKGLNDYYIFSKNDVLSRLDNSHKLDFSKATLNLNEEDIDVDINFEYTDTEYNFSFDLTENNHLFYKDFYYTYDLPVDFLNTTVYKELKNKQNIKGYFERNLSTNGGYHYVTYNFELKDGQLLIKCLMDGLNTASKSGANIRGFEGNDEYTEELIEDETTEISIPASLKRSSNGKAEEASTIKPTKKEGEVLPRMGIGPSFAGIPLIIVGAASIALALVFILRRRFPINTKINDEDKDTEE